MTDFLHSVTVLWTFCLLYFLSKVYEILMEQLGLLNNCVSYHEDFKRRFRSCKSNII